MLQKKVIILKKIKYAEANLILHTLSSEGERLNFIARSAAKSFKRFSAGVLEPLHYLKVSYTEARSGDLHLLKEAQVIEDFYNLRTNYECLNLALYFLSFVSRLTHESLDDNEELFNLLGNTLQVLKKLSKEKGAPCADASADASASASAGTNTNAGASAEALSQLKLRFEIKALHQQGVCPADLFHSNLLAKPIGEHPIVFSTEELSKVEAIKLKVYHALKEYLPNFE
ncbi:MAG: DNA repair protein RecO [Bdellovibrionaceae bacterium]|nr:DNA repair protein RecO [Pseudobdellovibrionaceae bacterium]